MTTDHAKNVVWYWENRRQDSLIHLSFIDFDKIEVYIEDGYNGTIKDAVEYVENVIFNSHL